MLKIDFKDLPSLPQADRRPVVRVAKDQIKNTGVSFNTFGIQVGDVIEFPAYDDIIVVAQPVRPNSEIMQYLAGVIKNGKPNYLALGALTRQDVNREYTCEFTKQMGELGDNEKRLMFLQGKKITAKETKDIKVQAFDNLTGVRLEGQTRDTKAPIITYAE